MFSKLLGAVLTGLLLYLAWPVGGFAPLLFIAFLPLLWVEQQLYEQRIALYKVFSLAYVAFFIWNFATTWWLHHASLGGAWFAISVNAGLISLVFWLYAFIKRKSNPTLALIWLACGWMSLEKLHLVWDFAWPWLNLGNGFAENPRWIQWYEYTGSFGGSLWIWWVNLSLFTGLLKFSKTRDKAYLWHSVLFSALQIGTPIAFSLYRFSHYQVGAQIAKVLVLQPNLDPYSEKFQKDNAETARDLIQLSQAADTAAFDYIIAPETALNRPIDLDHPMRARALQRIKDLTRRHPQTAFITGAEFERVYRDAKDLPEDVNRFPGSSVWFQSFNSALQITASDPLQVYQKSKLVVGVERIPYKPIVQRLFGDILIDLGGTSISLSTQTTRSVFTNSSNSLVAAPIICYESVFGAFVTDCVKKGANWLCIITNDGWWQKTQGYRQHLAYARLRAIENRRSIARSANTGVSAFISERGILQKHLDYDTRGSLSGVLHIQNKKTFYTRYGDYIARTAILIAALLLFYALMLSLKSRIKPTAPPTDIS